MNESQLKNLYSVNGLKDFKLITTEDLLNTHGIDYTAIDGYNNLDDLNKHLFKKFIINIFNAFGLELRATMMPKGIYFVEEIEYLFKSKPNDEDYTVAGCIVKTIDNNGLKTILHKWIYEGYEHIDVIEGNSSYYLRFEYEKYGRNEWVHVIDEKTWY